MHTPDDPLFPTSAASSDSSKLSPELRRTGLRLYRQAWDAYRKAGCPYGETDEAMLVWYSFQEETRDIPFELGKN